MTTRFDARRLASYAGGALALLLAFIALPQIAITAIAPDAPRLNQARSGHSATALADGRVLIAGGAGRAGALASIELLDAASTQSNAGPNLFEARTGHSATLLRDGRVLIAGGSNGKRLLNSAESYRTTDGRIASAGMLNHERARHSATLLADGRVLIAGGDREGTAEIFDPATGRFALAGQLAQARSAHAAILLPEGKVLLVGGAGASASTAELYDPRTLRSTLVRGGMRAARLNPTLALLPDGKVHVYGGDAELTMEIYNPKGWFSSLGHLLRDAGAFLAVLHSPARAALVNLPHAQDKRLAHEALGANGALFERQGHAATEVVAKGAMLVTGGVDRSGTPLDSIASVESCTGTVTTDLTDYQPGQTVIMSGSGWLPGEQISLNLHRDSNDPPDTQLVATADENGDWTNSEYLVQDFDVNVTFVLTATGESGCVAQTTFTDAGVFNYSPSPPTTTSRTIPAGSADSFVQQVTGPGNNGNFTASVIVTATGVNPLPASWVSTSPTALSFVTGSGASSTSDTESWTVFITVPSGASAGVYTASIKAAASITGIGQGNGSPVSITVTATTLPTTTTVTCPASVVYTGAALEPCTAQVTATDGFSQSLPVSYSNNTDAGLASASASFAGNATYLASNGSNTFVIDPAPSTTTVTFEAGPYTYRGSPFTATVSVTGAGGLALSPLPTYAGDCENVTVVDGCTASYTYAGDANHTGSSDSESITITQASSTTTVTFEAGPYEYRGSPFTATVSVTGAGGLSLSPTPSYSGDCENVTVADGCTASYTYDGDVNHTGSSDSESITITQASSTTTVTFEPGPYEYRGSPFTATVSVTGAGGLSLSPTPTYSGDCENVTVVDGCTASYTFAGDTNHTGSSDSESITITQAPSTTTVTFEAGPYVYRGSAFTATVSVTGAGGLSLSPTPTYSGDCENVTVANGCTASYTYAGDANHTGSSDSASITILQAPSTTTVTFEAGPYVYRDSPFTATASATGAGDLDVPLLVTYSGDCTNVTVANGCTGSASYPGDVNHEPSSDSTSITITPATLTVTADNKVRIFGDPNPGFTYQISGFAGDDTIAVVSGSASCTTSATQFSPVGAYDIVCTVGTLSAQNYTFSFAKGTLTIGERDALVRYIGQQTFVTSGTSATTAQVTLTASVQDPTGLALTGAKVDFIDANTGKVLAANVTVSPVPNSPNYTGTANAIVTLSTGQYGAESYLILVRMTGNYDNGDQAVDDKTATVTVAKPAGSNETTGGGSIAALATAAGRYAGNGDDVSFTVGLKYNKSVTNLQGKVTLSVPQADGVLLVRSNAISSMAVRSGNPKTSTIYVKASVAKVLADSSVVTIDGNVTLRVDIADGSPDKIGFTVLSSKDSVLYYSNQWVIEANAWRTAVETLKTGTVTVN